MVLAGDFNVVPTERDIYPTTSYRDNALLQPEPRQAYARLLQQGWTDAIRARHPEATVYTFWDYLRNRWPRNAGLRIDHLLLSESIAGRLCEAGVDREERGRVAPATHAPVWMQLAAARASGEGLTGRVLVDFGPALRHAVRAPDAVPEAKGRRHAAAHLPARRAALRLALLALPLLAACAGLPKLPAAAPSFALAADPAGPFAEGGCGLPGRLSRVGFQLLPVATAARGEAGARRTGPGSLDLQYYEWHGDATGRYLIAMLRRAAERGVRVRVLVDDLPQRRGRRGCFPGLARSTTPRCGSSTRSCAGAARSCGSSSARSTI